MSQVHAPAEGRVSPPDPRRWIALAVLLLASFMNLMDVTIVNVALPSMQQNLGASPSQIEWVVAAYILAFALGLLPFGRLGDIVGRRGMFVVGVGLFTLASALCGLAPSIEVLIGARVLQGLAGAIMTPQVLAIATVIFPPSERGFAFSFFGLASSLAAVTGPIIGGALISANIQGLDWRPIFLVNVPFGILATIAGLLLIAPIPAHRQLRNDYVGIVLFGLSILAVVFPLVEGRTYGWPAWAFGMIAAGLVGLLAFYLWERRREARNEPELLPVKLLANRNFAVGSLMSLVFFSGIPGFFMMLAIFYQAGFGLTPLESGLTTVPFPLGVFLASFISGRLGSRFLAQRVAVGALLLAAGMIYVRFTFGTVGTHIDHWAFVPPLAIGGLGLGIGISAIFQTVLMGVPHRDAGSASGSLQAFQQVGGALGVALVGEVFFTWLENAQAWGATSKADAFVHAAQAGTWYEIGAFLVVATLVLLLRPLPRQQAGWQGAGQGGAPAQPPHPIET
jgi:EmrB/QacA subfamily drug resistance transporter